jgi:arsenate reductase
MKNVLFLCVAKSARSQMAEGLARALAPAGTQCWSAGSAPATLNPLAVRALAERDIDIADHFSKGLDDVPREQIDTVITLCAEEVCPVFHGNVERLHWALPDPAAAQGSDEERLQAFRDVRDELERRLRAWFGGGVG